MLTAFVSGGTSGIGRAVVARLASQGYHVFALGTQEEHAVELRASVADAPGHVSIILGDICDSSTITAAVDAIEESGGVLDVLVNSAGTISGGGIEVESLDVWERVLAINLTGVFSLTKAALPFLKRSSAASIVNISSVCSLRPCASLSYSVTKAGLDMMTKVLARELAASRIRVNAVNPGVVRTNLQITAGLLEGEAAYQKWAAGMADLHPLGRIGEPNDVAALVDFLVGSEAGWITGGIFSVDGGRAIG
jgi:NAD(P)-dependent dehydrogenase (short-subunit alcohol dehydrogenase family)